MSKITDERLAEIANGSAETVYYGWPQKLVAEEAKKLAQLLEELREGFRVHDAGWKAANIENERWRRNSIETWEAMQSMRNSINEYIPMPSLESDLLQGPENSVFCASVAKAVIANVTELRSPPTDVRVTDRMIDLGVDHYSEGGCSGLSTFERREVVEGILHAALSSLEPQQEEAVALEPDMSQGWLIHKAGRGWYRPNAQGYTNDTAQAGRYSREDADAYSHPNGWDGPRDEITIRHESDLPAHPTPTQKEQESQRVSEAWALSDAKRLRHIQKLERRIRNQRQANRDNWQIVEDRAKWLGTKQSRAKYIDLLKRHRALQKEADALRVLARAALEASHDHVR